ncbi:MAG: regulatory protein RecX [Ruminococcaceae bacterium]|nr:regulatory protein RecX [Oscillospiraceae bacterium]
MTQITAIKETKRGRFALFGPEGFLFSVDDETLALNDLRTGDNLSDERLLSLREQSDLNAARETALRYLAHRAHGEAELVEKLCRRYDDETARAVAARLRDAGLLDDAAFAQSKAESLASRGKSRQDIRMRLLALGIGRPQADMAVAALDFDEAEAALALIRKQYAHKLQAGERQKVMAALSRRGFAHGTIVKAMDAAGEGEP